MSSPLTIVLVGSLLCLLQLAMGIAVGLWLRRPKALGRDADLRRAHSIALQLHGLTQQLGGSVSQHRERFEVAEERLQNQVSGKQNPTTDLVVGVVSEILAANRELQRELHDAEIQIAEKTVEIATHLDSALTDPLTDLPNRRALDEQLTRRLEDYRKHGIPFSLLMFDLDHFKQINDTFGHPVGDEVLKGLSGTMRSALRRHDFVARYGGEEFAVILPHTNLDEAQRAAGKASEGMALLSDQFAHLDRSVTASGGLASIAPGEEIASLVRRADEALYAAKENGRNCIYLHDGSKSWPLNPALAERDWEVSGGSDREENEEPPLDSTPEMPRSDELIGACGDLRNALFDFSDPEKS